MLKANRVMEYWVYEIKTYRKEDIKYLEKKEWYKHVVKSGIGTVSADHPTMQKLESVITDLLADIVSNHTQHRRNRGTSGKRDCTKND